MKDAKFRFVCFWSSCAWVAGLSRYNLVAQADEPRLAVERLVDAMMLVEKLEDVGGSSCTFTPKGENEEPLDEFKVQGNEIPWNHNGMWSKDDRYSGVIFYSTPSDEVIFARTKRSREDFES